MQFSLTSKHLSSGSIDTLPRRCRAFVPRKFKISQRKMSTAPGEQKTDIFSTVPSVDNNSSHDFTSWYSMIRAQLAVGSGPVRFKSLLKMQKSGSSDAADDGRVFPFNPAFKATQPTSDVLREQIYSTWLEDPIKWTPRMLSNCFFLSIQRIRAILHLKEIQRRMENAGFEINREYVRRMESFLAPIYPNATLKDRFVPIQSKQYVDNMGAIRASKRLVAMSDACRQKFDGSKAAKMLGKKLCADKKSVNLEVLANFPLLLDSRPDGWPVESPLIMLNPNLMEKLTLTPIEIVKTTDTEIMQQHNKKMYGESTKSSIDHQLRDENAMHIQESNLHLCNQERNSKIESFEAKDEIPNDESKKHSCSVIIESESKLKGNLEFVNEMVINKGVSNNPPSNIEDQARIKWEVGRSAVEKMIQNISESPKIISKDVNGTSRWRYYIVDASNQKPVDQQTVLVREPCGILRGSTLVERHVESIRASKYTLSLKDMKRLGILPRRLAKSLKS